MCMQRIKTSLFLGFAALLLVLPGTASARWVIPAEFTVQFSCGTSDGSRGVIAGEYAVLVSALNPGIYATVARARVVLTTPRGMTSDWVRTGFDPGAARVIDCATIRDGFFTFPRDLPDGLITGFLVIEGALSVVAQYTASGLSEVSSQVVDVKGVGGVYVPPRVFGQERVCHIPPGNPGNAHTIEVGTAAVPAHLGHGDYRGKCDED